MHADVHGASSCIVRNNDPSKRTCLVFGNVLITFVNMPLLLVRISYSRVDVGTSWSHDCVQKQCMERQGCHLRLVGA